MHILRNRNSIKKLFCQIPVHPFVFAIYPIITLLAFNITEVNTGDALMPILMALLSTAIILGVMRVLSRSWQVAGLLTSLLMVWFFIYGHLYNQLKGVSILGMLVGRHRYLLMVWSGIILAAAFWLVKKYRADPNLTLALNIFSASLFCLAVIQIGTFYFRNLFYPQTPAAGTYNPLISWTNDSPPPDIYYIVLDGYARSDVLKEELGIDNTAFLDSLRHLGFYVAECSQSNYTRTALSLTSTFNMEYLQTLNPQLTPDQPTSWLSPYLKHNLVRRQLEQLGYKTIVFKNPWVGLVWNDAAIVYKSTNSSLLSPFVYLLLSTTATRVYLDAHQAEILQNLNITPYYSNYIDTVYALEQLQKVPSIPGPKLVFVHLIIPHVPYVFGPDGEYIDIRPYDTVNHLYTQEDTIRGETAAVTYIDKRMLEIVPKLIQTSKTTPIIILAGDHGTGGSTVVTRNLEAFFVPGSQSTFYETITPVNIFRVLFDTYFNGSFGLLPDRSYYSAGGKYFNFQEIPNLCDAP
jgi:hypothetical protein